MMRASAAGIVLGLAGWIVGCGGAATGGAGTGGSVVIGAPGSAGAATGGASAGDERGSAPASASTTSTDGGDADVRALLVDAVTPHLCESMRGSFIGLPGEGGSTGVAAGSDPTAGRWWIRRCEARVDGDQLRLSIEGTGWTWVDRESFGFRIRQYLRFDARASFGATMDVGYDRAHRVATVWMRPGPGVEAEVRPRGLVRAEATNVLSSMLGGLLTLGGASPSARAEQQVAAEGSETLRQRFSTGFTVTFSMADQQMDFMVGALARGEVPVRPYPPEPGMTWSVNQRVRLWPGGLDVVGPLADGRGPQALDLELEEGEGVRVEALCAGAFADFYDRALQGVDAAVPQGAPVAALLPTERVARVQVPALGCPTLLVLTPREGATLPARLRLRVAPGVAPAPRAAASTGSTASTATTAASPPRGDASPQVRVQIAGLTIGATTADGGRWDLLGAEPDPYVVAVSVPGAREVDRTTAALDRHEIAAIDRWLPGAFRRGDLPLRFTVFDEDVGADEFVGTAELSAANVAGAGPSPSEVLLELRTAEAVPRTMGSLRLRLQALP